MPSVDKHFLDSGAFSQRAKSRVFKKKEHKSEWDYYKTDAFKEYRRKYVKFLKKHSSIIDYYANIDAIGNDKLSYENQKWLEKKGLTPVPVVHFDPKRNMRYLQKYIDEGHRFIGLGGMVIRGSQLKATEDWLDCCFSIAKKYPDLKFHGFGITKHELLVKYPWFSVDSTTWIKRGAFGEILVPRLINGKFIFHRKDVNKREHTVERSRPYIFAVSEEHRRIKSVDKYLTDQTKPSYYQPLKHKKNSFLGITKTKRSKILERIARGQEKNILAWLEYIDVDANKLATDNTSRVKANLRYFYELAKSISEEEDRSWPLTICFSGGGAEEYIDKAISIMMSFYPSRNKPEQRLLNLYSYKQQNKYTVNYEIKM